jgi:hypothetical protein
LGLPFLASAATRAAAGFFLFFAIGKVRGDLWNNIEIRAGIFDLALARQNFANSPPPKQIDLLSGVYERWGIQGLVEPETILVQLRLMSTYMSELYEIL